MPKTIFAIINVLMALSYAFMGLFLIIFPESYFAQMVLPSTTWAYALGGLLVIYGCFRAWRVYQKLKGEDDDEDEQQEYRYYDGKKGL
ncbi:hypothetical protein SAMN04515674_11581 [Pseudarcicella hirudinis]|uniref:Uncharacterized protein n=1 Tax=Pseudarcicella hirudinis TaxID=1079859 RepID=A0A1I5XND8_9BACT|nr:hypothetical protein [Pseudarcicella hirudinis]SFQ33471.1 hypothetical protein SAMN04515674_11581 [Pseudarcicella hirudinis]